MQPDARYYEAKRTVERGGANTAGCPLVEILHAEFTKKPYIEGDQDLARAYEIYSRTRQSRLLLEAMLIAQDSTTERICTVMGTRFEMVDAYKRYFFDTTVFRDKFDVNEYISKLADLDNRMTKKVGFTQGFYYVAAQFTGGDLHLSPLEICKKLQVGAYRMFQQGATSVITSEEAKEAKAWANIARSVSEYIEKKQPSTTQADFLEEFKVIFKMDDHVKPISTIEGQIVRG